LADLTALQQTLGISLNNPSRLEQAVVHDSYLNENPNFRLASNERLEFLGDAVLGLIVAQKLYHDFPCLSEGEMTRLRSALVCQGSLARVARTIKLGEYLYLGKGEEATGGRKKPANLARALEAVIAAIYLDQDPATTENIVLKLFGKTLQKTASQGVTVDYKSQLQEHFQAKLKKIPVYRVVATTGPAHERNFTVEVRIGDTLLGRGTGKSKKAADIEAARSALEHLGLNFTL
jgi:ribonuclease-3